MNKASINTNWTYIRELLPTEDKEYVIACTDGTVAIRNLADILFDSKQARRKYYAWVEIFVLEM